MPKFLIEFPHVAEPVGCARIVEVFLRTGSHFLTNAEWGCKDGDHRALIVVDVGSKDEALQIVPPALRPRAKIVQLNTFKLSDVEAVLRQHGAAPAGNPG
jgi:hypothetical protein